MSDQHDTSRALPRRRLDLGGLAAGLTILASGGFFGLIIAAWLHLA